MQTIKYTVVNSQVQQCTQSNRVATNFNNQLIRQILIDEIRYGTLINRRTAAVKYIRILSQLHRWNSKVHVYTLRFAN